MAHEASTMRFSQLTIFGAGLIGGSVAHKVRESALAERVVAVDIEPPPPTLFPFDEWIRPDDQAALDATLARSDLTLLCAPVRIIAQLVPLVLDRSPGWVTDCGSTKAAIVKGVENHPARSRFVAGHPMAGHPEGGLKNARADLFGARKWILCPSGSSAEAAAAVTNFVGSLGAEVVTLDATEHDRSVAVTSHVPQVIASALSVFAHDENAKQAAGPGFASSTRVAGGAEAMWRDIFSTNAESIGAALDDLGATLQKLGKQLKAGEVEGTLEVLEKARHYRDKS